MAIDRERVALGAQLFVEHGNDVIADLAVGSTLGLQALTTSHLHSGFCLTKPLLALCIGHLLDNGLVEMASSVTEIIGDRTYVPEGATLNQILNHSAGLARPAAIDWRMCPPNLRDELLEQSKNRKQAAYSEVSSGLVLEDVILQVSGLTAENAIEQWILLPLGLEHEIVISAQRAIDPLVSERVMVPFGGLPTEAIPLLSERMRGQLLDTRPAFSGFVSMSGIGRLFASICKCLNGSVADGMPSPGSLNELMAHPREPGFDSVLRRECQFAGGFLIGLRDHSFTARSGPRAVAAAAGITPCIALTDPDADLTMSVYMNGSLAVTPPGLDWLGLREALTDRVYADLGM